jgi:hypothetical protein
MAALGLSISEVAALSPEEQFRVVSMAIADMADHNSMATAAMDMFGTRVGTKLLPMLKQGSESFTDLQQRAHELGIVFDQEGADAAAAYTDMMHELGNSMRGVMMELGPLIGEIMTNFVPPIIDAVSAVVEWIGNNQELAGVLIAVGAAVGALFVVLGPLLVMLPGIIAAVTGAIAVFTAIAAVMSGPVALAIGAVIAIGVGIYTFWDEIGGIVMAGVGLVLQGIEMMILPFTALLDLVNYVAQAIAGVFGMQIPDFSWAGIKGGVSDMLGIDGERAAGGPVQAGKNYLVGENGPEWFSPNTSGYVHDNKTSQQMGGMNVAGPLVSISGVTLANGMDIDRLAQQLGDKLRQRLTGIGYAAGAQAI